MDGQGDITPARSVALIAPFAHATTYQRIRDSLRADIIAGAFEPAERLKMAALVHRYGVSPAPIREALGQLEGEGWLEILPNRGARVRPIRAAFIRELFEIRIALEPLLAGYSCAAATSDDIARLRAIHVDYLDALSRIDGLAILSANRNFHNAILSIRPNRAALTLLEQHSVFVGATRRRYGFPQTRFPTMITEHEALIEAFARSDPEAAREAMRIHIQHSIDELIPRVIAAENARSSPD